MKNGWLKIHRSMLEWEHFGEPSVVTVFLTLLLSAGKDGTTDISLKELSSITKLTTNTIRCALSKLVDSGEISRTLNIGQKTTTKINSWDKYQVYQKLTHSKIDSLSKIDTPPCQKLIHSVSKIDTPPHYNNNKNVEECNEKDAHAHTHEDFVAEAMNDLRIEQGCIALRITAEQYKRLVNEVINDWMFSDLPDNEWTLTHLLGAMRIKHNINQRNNGTTQPIIETGNGTNPLERAKIHVAHIG